MAGQLKVDSINADSNLSLRIANTAVAFIDSNGLRPVSGNVSLDSTGTTGIRSPSANTLVFFEGGVEAMRIDANGNIGIGTSSPAQKLDIGGSGNSIMRLLAAGQGNGLEIGQLTSDGGNKIFAVNNNYLAIGTNNTEQMRITSDGNVGIGTTSPTLPLIISKPQGAALIQSTTSTNSAYLAFNNGGGTSYVGVDTSTGSIFSSGAYGMTLFNAANSATTFFTNATERMRIDPSGNLGVGTSGTSGSKFTILQSNSINTQYLVNNNASTCYGMQIYYSARTPNNTGEEFIYCGDTGQRFSARSNGGLANYSGNNVNLSDEREKTNIELAGNYLSKICSIPVKTFNYIDQNREEDDGLTLGVIAQDVQNVAPELIMESNWGTKEEPKMRFGIYQTDLQYALMKSIQELNAKVEAQATEIAELKAR